MARRCGYCRDYGHDFSKCSLRIGTKEAILKHVYNERKRIIEMMIGSGFGVGAMVNLYCYGQGMTPCIITDPNETIRDLYHGMLAECRMVKYSKQVAVTFRSFTGHIPQLQNWERMQVSSPPSLTIRATPITGTSSSISGYVHITSFDRKYITGNQLEAKSNSYTWERCGELLAPSYDGEVNLEAIAGPVILHDRLTRNSEPLSPHP